MNKKKIGIITFHSSHNCGSMLQAYALQTVLEKRYGAEVEIIDFSNKGSRNLYGLFDFRLKKVHLGIICLQLGIGNWLISIEEIILILRKSIYIQLSVNLEIIRS